MMAGAAIYVVGLGIMAAAQGALARIISGGLIGVALSCTATSLAMAACVRAVSEERRSMMLGLVRVERGGARMGTIPLLLFDPSVLDHLAPEGNLLFEASGKLGRRGGFRLRSKVGELSLHVRHGKYFDSFCVEPVGDFLWRACWSQQAGECVRLLAAHIQFQHGRN
jgi:hypothetical protein